jgi:hypothetical protein
VCLLRKTVTNTNRCSTDLSHRTTETGAESSRTKKCTRVAKSGVLTIENLSSRPGDFGRSGIDQSCSCSVAQRRCSCS